MVCGFKNLPFGIIGKCSDYPYHANTSNVASVMIDATHRLAYPLAKRLEGIANERMVGRGKNIYDIWVLVVS
jgi:hypothetical protein